MTAGTIVQVALRLRDPAAHLHPLLEVDGMTGVVRESGNLPPHRVLVEILGHLYAVPVDDLRVVE